MKKIYVGNLPWTCTEEELNNLFAEVGTVHSAAIVTDRETGRSRGFAFVEMDDDAADQAIEKVNGTEMEGRQLNISESHGGGGGGRDGRSRR